MPPASRKYLYFALIAIFFMFSSSSRAAKNKDLLELGRHAVAVVIGSQKYSRAPVDVKYAYNDAVAIRDWLLKIGFSRHNIIFLKDATKADLEDIFGTRDYPCGRLCRKARKGLSDVFVYYSGHGVPDTSGKRAWLLPTNVSPDSPHLGYPMDLLMDNLQRIARNVGPKRRVFVMLEACFSGQSGGGALLSVSAPGFGPPIPRGQGLIRIVAAGRDQAANWDHELKLGLMTSRFLIGAAGLADDPEHGGNGDGLIAWEELADFVRVETALEASKRYARQQNVEIDVASFSLAPVKVKKVSLYIMQLEDEMIWHEAKLANNLESYENYLLKCGEICEYKKEAENRINFFMCKLERKKDIDSWRLASREATVKAFQKYLSGCLLREKICKNACTFKKIAMQKLSLNPGSVGSGKVSQEINMKKIQNKRNVELIMDIQRLLKRRKCYNGEVDGIIGSKTKSAIAMIKRFNFNDINKIEVLLRIYYELNSSKKICRNDISLYSRSHGEKSLGSKRRRKSSSRDPFPKLENGTFVSCFQFNGRRYCE